MCIRDRFSDRTRGWIEERSDLMACVIDGRKAKQRGIPRSPHFMGIDLGLVGDGSAVAIGHIEDGKVILDCVEQIKAGEGAFVDKERLEFDDVADWVYEWTKKFYIKEGMFDQWAGIPFEQALAKRGLKSIKSKHFTKTLTSQMFQNFKNLMFDEKLELYNDPSEEEELSDYLQELLELQAQVHSKHLITVEAPQVDGKHDDMSDAIVRMVWCASQNMSKQLRMTTSSGKVFGNAPINSNRRHVKSRVRAMKGGSHPSRYKKR